MQQAAEPQLYVTQRNFKDRDYGKIYRGARYAATDSTESGSLRLKNCDPFGSPSELLIDPDGKGFWMFDRRGRLVQIKTGGEPLFQRRKGLRNQPQVFAAELIYSGLAGKVVQAVYREYVNDMARPAFTQELQYDLGEERSIAYKSLRMRVEDATISTIRYSVVSDSDLPWLPAPSNAESACKVVP